MPLCVFPGSSKLLRLGEEVTFATLPRSTSRDELQALPVLGGNRSPVRGTGFFPPVDYPPSTVREVYPVNAVC